MQRHLSALILPLVLGVACSRPKPSTEPLMEADIAFARATASRGLEGFQSFLAEDVMTIRPNLPVIKGREAVAKRWAPLLEDSTVTIRWHPLEAMISDSGDLGYTVGAYEITRTDEKGRHVAGTGKYVTIWRREPGGSWKVVFDSGVQDTPAGAPQQQ